MSISLRTDHGDYVWEQMGRTSALDGRQSATWPEFEADWGCHPDRGLNVIITTTA